MSFLFTAPPLLKEPLFTQSAYTNQSELLDVLVWDYVFQSCYKPTFTTIESTLSSIFGIEWLETHKTLVYDLFEEYKQSLLQFNEAIQRSEDISTQSEVWTRRFHSIAALSQCKSINHISDEDKGKSDLTGIEDKLVDLQENLISFLKDETIDEPPNFDENAYPQGSSVAETQTDDYLMNPGGFLGKNVIEGENNELLNEETIQGEIEQSLQPERNIDNLESDTTLPYNIASLTTNNFDRESEQADTSDKQSSSIRCTLNKSTDTDLKYFRLSNPNIEELSYPLSHKYTLTFYSSCGHWSIYQDQTLIYDYIPASEISDAIFREEIYKDNSDDYTFYKDKTLFSEHDLQGNFPNPDDIHTKIEHDTHTDLPTDNDKPIKTASTDPITLTLNTDLPTPTNQSIVADQPMDIDTPVKADHATQIYNQLPYQKAYIPFTLRPFLEDFLLDLTTQNTSSNIHLDTCNLSDMQITDVCTNIHYDIEDNPTPTGTPQSKISNLYTNPTQSPSDPEVKPQSLMNFTDMEQISSPILDTYQNTANPTSNKSNPTSPIQPQSPSAHTHTSPRDPTNLSPFQPSNSFPSNIYNIPSHKEDHKASPSYQANSSSPILTQTSTVPSSPPFTDIDPTRPLRSISPPAPATTTSTHSPHFSYSQNYITLHGYTETQLTPMDDINSIVGTYPSISHSENDEKSTEYVQAIPPFKTDSTIDPSIFIKPQNKTDLSNHKTDDIEFASQGSAEFHSPQTFNEIDGSSSDQGLIDSSSVEYNEPFKPYQTSDSPNIAALVTDTPYVDYNKVCKEYQSSDSNKNFRVHTPIIESNKESKPHQSLDGDDKANQKERNSLSPKLEILSNDLNPNLLCSTLDIKHSGASEEVTQDKSPDTTITKSSEINTDIYTLVNTLSSKVYTPGNTFNTSPKHTEQQQSAAKPHVHLNTSTNNENNNSEHSPKELTTRINENVSSKTPRMTRSFNENASNSPSNTENSPTKRITRSVHQKVNINSPIIDKFTHRAPERALKQPSSPILAKHLPPPEFKSNSTTEQSPPQRNSEKSNTPSRQPNNPSIKSRLEASPTLSSASYVDLIVYCSSDSDDTLQTSFSPLLKTKEQNKTATRLNVKPQYYLLEQDAIATLEPHENGYTVKIITTLLASDLPPAPTSFTTLDSAIDFMKNAWMGKKIRQSLIKNLYVQTQSLQNYIKTETCEEASTHTQNKLSKPTRSNKKHLTFKRKSKRLLEQNEMSSTPSNKTTFLSLDNLYTYFNDDNPHSHTQFGPLATIKKSGSSDILISWKGYEGQLMSCQFGNGTRKNSQTMRNICLALLLREGLIRGMWGIDGNDLVEIKGHKLWKSNGSINDNYTDNPNNNVEWNKKKRKHSKQNNKIKEDVLERIKRKKTNSQISLDSKPLKSTSSDIRHHNLNIDKTDNKTKLNDKSTNKSTHKSNETYKSPKLKVIKPSSIGKPKQISQVKSKIKMSPIEEWFNGKKLKIVGGVTKTEAEPEKSLNKKVKLRSNKKNMRHQ